jgi:hypothetical protein
MNKKSTHKHTSGEYMRKLYDEADAENRRDLTNKAMAAMGMPVPKVDRSQAMPNAQRKNAALVSRYSNRSHIPIKKASAKTAAAVHHLMKRHK